MEETAGPSEREITLEGEFAEIVRAANIEGSVVAEKVTDMRQFKYRIDDAAAYKKRLEALGAVRDPGGPIEQTDYYFLYPGEEPGVDTDTLCWREEKRFVDYEQPVPQDTPEVGQLILKTDPRDGDPNPVRTVRYALVDDIEAQYRVLEKLHTIRKGNDLAPYRVSKKRTTYLLPMEDGDPLVINIDEHVELSDDSNDYAAYPTGNYLKIKVPKDSSETIDHLQEVLGLTDESFDIPYFAKEAFVRKLHTSRPQSLRIDREHLEHHWLKSAHAPYYYDARSDSFLMGIDPNKLKGFNSYEQKLIQDEIESICARLDETSGGQDLASRQGGGGKGGSSTYERLTAHDGFARYPSICANFASTTLWRKRWQPADRRIIFSRVTFDDKPNLAGVFIHYIGDHDGYERWLDQHRVV